MREFLLFLCSVILIQHAQSQYIQNGDFENWAQSNYYTYPDNWFILTENNSANVRLEKSTDSQEGSYAVKLKTTVNTGDTVFGLGLYGILGNDLSFKGMPFTTTGDMLHFNYKSNVVTGDLGLVMCILYKNNQVVDSVTYPILASQATWASVQIPVNSGQIQPDSMFLGFLSSLPSAFGGSPLPGTWLLVDNVYFTLGVNPTPLPVPNYSFENWSTASAEDPVSWSSSNQGILLIQNSMTNVVKTTDVYTGTYAARLSTVIQSGNIVEGLLDYSQPFTTLPASFKFFYKYMPSGDDTAVVFVQFLKNGTEIGSIYYQIGSEVINYQQLTLPLSLNDTPDTLKVFLFSGNNAGSVLYVDNIKFPCATPLYAFGQFTSSSAINTTWTPVGSETQWQLEWGLSGFTQGTGNTVLVYNSHTYNITGISDVNAYDFYVRAICSPGDTSAWTDVSTVCKGISVPYLENFETTYVGTLPSCWKPLKKCTSVAAVESSGNALSGAKNLVLSKNLPCYSGVVLPITAENINTLALSFYARKGTLTNNAVIQLGTMSNPADVNTFEPLQNFLTTGNYQKMIYNFGTYSGTDKFIALMLTSNDAYAEIFIDSLKLDLIPVCMVPSGLQVNNITNINAHVSWDAGNQNLWNLVYGYYGFNPANAGTYLYGLTTPEVTLNLLTSGATFDVYVQADCDAYGNSDWTQITFSTLCSQYSVPFEQNFDATYINEIPNCWQKKIKGSGSVIVNNQGGFSPSGALKMHVVSQQDTVMLITPSIIPNVSDLYLSFYAKELNGVSQLEVGTLNFASDDSSFTLLNTIFLTENYNHYVCDLHSYSGSHNRIAFRLKSAGAYTEIFIDNISITNTPVCYHPQNISLTNLTTTTASLTWQAGGSENMWNLIYVPSGSNPFTHGTNIPKISANNYNLTNLISGQSYDVYLQSDCGNGILSYWSSAFTFTVLCNPFNAPYTELFDNSSSLPLCWKTHNTHSSLNAYAGLGSTLPFSALNHLYINNTNTADPNAVLLIASPLLANVNNKKVTFYARADVSGTTLLLGYMTNQNNPATFNLITTINLTTSYTLYTISLTSLSGNVYFAFKHGEAGAGNNKPIFIDDFIFDENLCPKPTSPGATGVTSTGALLQWQAGGSESLWNIEVGLSGFVPGNSQQVTGANGINTNSWLASALQPNTSYEFYVRTDCGSGLLSAWTGPATFATLCNSFNLPYTEDFELQNNCWTITDMDGITPQWNKTTAINHTTGGSHALQHAAGIAANPQTGYLTSPPLLLPAGSQIEMSFWSNNQNPEYYKKTSVYATIDGTNYIKIWEETNPDNYWKMNIVSLTPFAGQTVGLQFRFEGSEVHSWAIDDISVYETDCPSTDSLTVTGITSQSATFNWVQGGNEMNWNVVIYDSAMSNVITSQIVSSTPQWVYNNLQPDAYYNFLVQSDCGSGQTGVWTGPLAFRTECISNTIPYAENFDNVASGFMPDCWHRIVEADFLKRVEAHNDMFYSAPHSLILWNGNTYENTAAILAVMPPVDDISTFQLKFYARSNANNTPLIIGTLPLPGDTVGFDEFRTIQLTESYQLYNVNFNTYTGSDKYIAFKHGNAQGGNGQFLSIDNVALELAEDCPAPTPVTVTYVSTNDALISWNENGSAAQWQIEWGLQNFTQGNGQMQYLDSTSIMLTPMIPGTFYDFYVRSVCGDGDTSLWAGPYSIKSDYICPQGSIYGQEPLPIQSVLWSAQEMNSRVFQSFDNISTAFNGLHIWGTEINPSTFGGCIHNPTSLEITFYEDNGGKVGAQTASFITQVVPDSTYSTYGNGFQIFEFGIQLPIAIQLTKGWFSVRSVNAPDCYTLFANTHNPAAQGTLLTVLNADTIYENYPLAYCFVAGDIYSVNYLNGQGGYIEGMASQQVMSGTNTIPVTAIAEPCYQFTQWSDSRTDNPRFDAAVNHSFDVMAQFNLRNIENWDTLTICQGDTLYFGSQKLTAQGNYDGHLISPEGCDSLVHLTLYVNPSFVFETTAAICIGDAYQWRSNTYTQPGNYYDSLQSIQGCDSVYVLHLIVNPVYTFLQYDSVCQGLVYNWRNQTLNQAGIYYDSLVTTAGCDSVYVLHLTQINEVKITELHEICQGTMYMWRNKICSIPGVYYDTLQTQQGCDTIFQLTLSVNPKFLFNHFDTICQGENFTWRSHSYSQAGVYYDSLLTLKGCDSVYVLHLTVGSKYFFEQTAHICQGASYSWRGHTYSTQGIFYDSLITYTGCDSIYKLNLFTNPKYEFLQTENVCLGDSLLWRNHYYKVSGFYYDSLLTQKGCDSVYVLHLMTKTPYEFVQNLSICQGGSLNWHGMVYTTAGTYYDSLQTTYGCDSVYVLQLTVNSQYEFIEQKTICDGDNYMWHGHLYENAGTYYDSLQTIFGCDSVFILVLYFNQSYLFTEQQQICEGDTLYWRGQPCYQMGYYWDSLTTVLGCDSVYRLELSFKISYLFEDNISVCQYEDYIWRGHQYFNAGTYYDSLLTQDGCDSVFVLHLTKNPRYEFYDIINLCQGDTFLWRGNTYETEGAYFDSLLTTVGCDSVYILILQVNPTYNFTTNAQICSENQYQWRGQYYNTTGTYSDSYQTQSGCDSTYTLNLIVNPSYHYVTYDTICHGTPYSWHNQTYTTTGVYYDNHLISGGCDSNYVLHLFVKPSYVFTTFDTICEGAIYNWRGHDYNTHGIYYDSLTAYNGCDSIYVLNLYSYPAFHSIVDMQICTGGNYYWRNNYYNATGTYNESYLTPHGCDSIYTLILTVDTIFLINEQQTVCSGSSFYWRNHQYITPGTYYDTVTSPGACDTVYRLILNNYPVYLFETTASICQGQTYSWRNNTYTTQGAFYNPFYSVNGCDSVYKLNLTVYPKYHFTENITICSGNDYLWRGQICSQQGAYFDSLLTINNCDSVFQLNLIVKPAYEIIESAYVCQGNIYAWRNHAYYAAGTYYDSLLTAFGCDSVYILHLNHYPAFLSADTIEICQGDSLLWRGHYYNTSGAYYDSLQTVNSCDSIFKLQLFVRPAFAYHYYPYLCDGDTILWRGHSYYTAGTYYDSLQTLYGCDSLFVLHLVQAPKYHFTDTIEICEGDTLLWRGNKYQSTGIFYDSLQSQYFCDSVYILHLTVHPEFEYSENAVICQGQTFYWRGFDLTQAGTYYDSLITIYGCDSVFVIELIVHPVFYEEETHHVCSGEVYFWRGNYYSASGWYYDSLLTVLTGCDSVFALHLIVEAPYQHVDDVNICAGDIYIWHGQSYNVQGLYFDSLQSVYGCDSVMILNLMVNQHYQYIENAEMCEGEILPWHGQSLSLQGTYYDSLNTIMGCDSVYIMNLVVHPSYEDIQNEQICHGDTIIWRGNNYMITGIYYDSLQTQEFGCDSLFVLNLNVITVDISVNHVSTTLTSNATDAAFQWIDCNNNFAEIQGEINNSFTATENGNYAVIVIQSNCVDTSDCYTIDDVSVLEFEGEKYFNIYPNPGDGHFILQMGDAAEVVLYNILGDILYSNHYTHGLHEINLKHLSDGVYYLSISNKNTYIYRKVIVQK